MNKKLLALLSYTGVSLITTQQAHTVDVRDDEASCVQLNFSKLHYQAISHISNIVSDAGNSCCGNGGCTCNNSCR